jgi:hypothetical protein
VVRWQRVAILGVVAWLVAVVMWANRSWTETVPVVTPVGASAQSRTFVCGAPLGSNTVTERTPPSDLPLDGRPCEEHGERRVLAVVDVGVGVVLIAGLAYLGRRSAARHDEDALVD